MISNRISVVIPAKNEAAYIVRCLTSLKTQSCPGLVQEVLVVDNGSTDETAELASKLGAKVLDGDGLKIGALRNAGARIATGDTIAFIDADCEAGKEWARGALECLNADSRIGAVGGYIVPPPEGSWLERCWALPQMHIEKQVLSLATGCFFIRRSLFFQMGGFKEDIEAGEDYEFSSRLLGQGLILKKSPSANVIHYGWPKTISGFLRRQIWQTSDYLKTRKPGFDKTFFLTHLFWLCLLGTVSLFPFRMLAAMPFTVSILLGAGLGLSRLFASQAPRKPVLIVQVITLNYLYLLGRSIGLTKSYFKAMASWINPARK